MRFEFQATMTATATVHGEDANAARGALLDVLEGAGAKVVGASGATVELLGIRPRPDVALLRVDGRDPLVDLERALRTARGDHGAGGGAGPADGG